MENKEQELVDTIVQAQLDFPKGMSAHEAANTLIALVREHDGWVSVDDELPENKTQVLCLSENGYVTRIYFNGDWYNENMASTQSVSGDVEDIYYWALLPAPPTTEKE